jgi:hypothetical protein
MIMSRSGYSDDIDDTLAYGRWRAQVKNSIRSKRGQAFLCELADAMDAMPEKKLITSELIDSEGACCTIGVVCKSRGLDVSKVYVDDPEQVGGLVGITRQLAAEIEYENDECGFESEIKDGKWVSRDETPEERWARMRKWVGSRIIKAPETAKETQGSI